ncbi:MAG: diacylglycerol O-acyltransferase [Candidatus Azotimanducaceae bacterium]|jgi:diacylglycerol O-acyltransferase
MRISEQAASFLFVENALSPMHAAAITTLSEDLALTDLQDHIASRLHLCPKYRQKLAYVPFNLAQPLWADDDAFDIAQHISESTTQGTSTAELLSHAAALSLELLPRNQPLWRMHLIHHAGKAAVLQTVHHALLEGVSIGDDAQVFFDLKADAKAVDVPEWNPRPAPSANEMMLDAIRDNTKSFSSRAQDLQSSDADRTEMLRRATESVLRFVNEPVQAAPWNRGVVGAKRDFCYREFAYGDVRKIKRALGGIENDVVLTVVSEAAARYINEHQDSVEGAHLRIMCPVRIRREDDDGVRGSRISGTFPVLNAQPQNIIDRHQQVRWENDAIRNSREAHALQLLVELAPPLPAIPSTDWFAPSAFGSMFTNMGLNPATFNPLRLLGQLMPQNLGRTLTSGLSQVAGFNFNCVSVPGAQTTQYLANRQVDQQFILPALAGNLGFAVAITTYAQTITFNLVCDPELLPDLERMAQLFEEVFLELLSTAQTEAAQI